MTYYSYNATCDMYGCGLCSCHCRGKKWQPSPNKPPTIPDKVAAVVRQTSRSTLTKPASKSAPKKTSSKPKVKSEPWTSENSTLPVASTSSVKPKRVRALPARLQDYVSNDYISQIEMGSKLPAPLSTKPTHDSSSSGESDSESESDTSVSKPNQQFVSNGGISERVKRKRSQQVEAREASDTDDKDSIYVTELSIDGIPTVVIESSSALSEQEKEEVLKAAAATGSLMTDSKTNGEVQRVTIKLDKNEPVSMQTLESGKKRFKQALALSDNSNSINNNNRVNCTAKRKRGRPHKQISLNINTPGTSPVSPASKKSRLEYTDAAEEQRSLLITITDMTCADKIHCQKVSRREASRLNLPGFDVHQWLESTVEDGVGSSFAEDDATSEKSSILSSLHNSLHDTR